MTESESGNRTLLCSRMMRVVNLADYFKLH